MLAIVGLMLLDLLQTFPTASWISIVHFIVTKFRTVDNIRWCQEHYRKWIYTGIHHIVYQRKRRFKAPCLVNLRLYTFKSLLFFSDPPFIVFSNDIGTMMIWVSDLNSHLFPIEGPQLLSLEWGTRL